MTRIKSLPRWKVAFSFVGFMFRPLVGKGRWNHKVQHGPLALECKSRDVHVSVRFGFNHDPPSEPTLPGWKIYQPILLLVKTVSFEVVSGGRTSVGQRLGKTVVISRFPLYFQNLVYTYMYIFMHICIDLRISSPFKP